MASGDSCRESTREYSIQEGSSRPDQNVQAHLTRRIPKLTKMSAEGTRIELGAKTFQDAVLQVQAMSLAAWVEARSSGVSLESGLWRPVEKIGKKDDY